jgi:hypothetical protein
MIYINILYMMTTELYLLSVNTLTCCPHDLFLGSEVKIGYMFQPPRWSSSGLIANVIGTTFCH